MKVLLVNKLYYPHIGGVEKHVRDLAIALKDKVDVEVLATHRSLRTKVEYIDGIKVTKVASPLTLKSAPLAPTFSLWLKKFQADIYHLHFPYPPGELAYLLLGAPGKLVVTYHSDIVRQKGLLALYLPWLKRLLARADKILTSSPQMIANSPWLQLNKDKCEVIPFGIDIKPFLLTQGVQRKAEQIKAKYGSPLLLFVGRLIYYKGVEYLLTAMTQVNAKLLIVGQGPLERHLKEQTKQLGLGQKVYFLPHQSEADLVAFYHACDVFVLPSIAKTEAFGYVQLEAEACKKPVVSTDLPTGVPYANLPNITGIVVPPKDSEALAKSINTLLTNKALAAKLGEQGFKRVSTEFTLEAMGRKVFQIYQEILGSPKVLG